MPEARGTVTEEELQMYSRANIMLLDNSNGTTGSGGSGSVSGSGSYDWELIWDSDGFQSYSWEVDTWENWTQRFMDEYANGTLEEFLESDLTLAFGIMDQIRGNGHFYGCARLTEL